MPMWPPSPNARPHTHRMSQFRCISTPFACCLAHSLSTCHTRYQVWTWSARKIRCWIPCFLQGCPRRFCRPWLIYLLFLLISNSILLTITSRSTFISILTRSPSVLLLTSHFPTHYTVGSELATAICLRYMTRYTNVFKKKKNQITWSLIFATDASAETAFVTKKPS